jgi:hypothetical protein
MREEISQTCATIERLRRPAERLAPVDERLPSGGLEPAAFAAGIQTNGDLVSRGADADSGVLGFIETGYHDLMELGHDVGLATPR